MGWRGRVRGLQQKARAVLCRYALADGSGPAVSQHITGGREGWRSGRGLPTNLGNALRGGALVLHWEAEQVARLEKACCDDCFQLSQQHAEDFDGMRQLDGDDVVLTVSP